MKQSGVKSGVRLPKTSVSKVSVNLKFTEDLWVSFRRLAARQDKSASALLRELMQEAIEKQP